MILWKRRRRPCVRNATWRQALCWKCQTKISVSWNGIRSSLRKDFESFYHLLDTFTFPMLTWPFLEMILFLSFSWWGSKLRKCLPASSFLTMSPRPPPRALESRPPVMELWQENSLSAWHSSGRDTWIVKCSYSYPQFRGPVPDIQKNYYIYLDVLDSALAVVDRHQGRALAEVVFVPDLHVGVEHLLRGWGLCRLLGSVLWPPELPPPPSHSAPTPGKNYNHFCLNFHFHCCNKAWAV